MAVKPGPLETPQTLIDCRWMDGFVFIYQKRQCKIYKEEITNIQLQRELING
jgi:hypothetical protein